MSALATASTRVESGTRVLCTPFRLLTVLAKMAVTLDDGIGSGGHGGGTRHVSPHSFRFDDKPAEVARLPDHYRGPFDRALVAQARFEPLDLFESSAAAGLAAQLTETARSGKLTI